MCFYQQFKSAIAAGVHFDCLEMWFSERATRGRRRIFMTSPALSSKARFARCADVAELAVDHDQDVIKRALDHADIAALARAIWESNGCPSGSDEEDWFEAERKLRTNGRGDPGVAAYSLPQNAKKAPLPEEQHGYGIG
jgi:hypothetical protein